MKDYEIAIHGAYERCVSPEEVVQVEKLIIKEIEKRIRDGRSNCLECDISALTYHNTIRIVFDDLIHRRKMLNSPEVEEKLKEILNGKI